jgi:anion-transporting  ArsA/GET3 family ATPase
LSRVERPQERPSEARPERPLLARRLIVVTGKGGTGKTTVAAALARAAAARGRKVLVAETGRDENVPRLLGHHGGPVGHKGIPTPAGPLALRLEPYEALAEYLNLQLRVPGAALGLLRQSAFRQLMDAAPGWRELVTLGKVWHLEQAREDDAPRFDLLVVDAPATGHGLTFLDVPRVVVSAIRSGPLRRHARWVESLVRDPERTLLLPVALAEEMPARETVELVDRLREQVGVAVDRVIVNAVEPAPFPPDLPDLDRRIAALPSTPGPTPEVWAACARHLAARHEMNRRYVAEIAAETRLPAVVLPLLPAGIRGPDDLAALEAPLLDAEGA